MSFWKVQSKADAYRLIAFLEMLGLVVIGIVALTLR
jgi:hypothetical protein